METAGHLIWPIYNRKKIHCNPLAATGGLGASSASLVRFSRGPSGNVFQLPDMTAWRGVFQGAGGEDVHFVLSLSIADFFQF